MNYFVIGDIHGCFYTFTNMIEKHWDKENEMLIQVGDLIDRGKNSPQMVERAIELRNEYPEQVIFLKGNHEFEMTRHFKNRSNFGWLAMGGAETVRQYENSDRNVEKDVEWMEQLPLYWENEHLFISHAGIAEDTENIFVESDVRGVLWNRSKLRNIDKLQIIGHTPGNKPHYDKKSNTWNIDTGAVFSNYLTGIKVKSNGEVMEFIKERTDSRDV